MTRAFVLHSESPDDKSGGDQASRLRELVESLDSGQADSQGRNTPSRHIPPERRIPIIAVASGKGGVGKTTTSVNLSIALAAHNRRAILMDADIGLANADVLCGLMPKNRLDLAANGSGGLTLEDLAIDAPGGFRLIPGSVGIGRVDELNDVERRILLNSLQTLHTHNDVVLIDTSAGLGPSVTEFISAADVGLIVVTPEPTSIADAYALIKVLVTAKEGQRHPVLSLVVNQVSGEREAEQVHDRIAGVCDRFLGYQMPMIGYIRKDKKVLAAVRSRVPYMIDAPKSAAAKDMSRLAQALIQWAGIEGRAAANASRRGWFARR
ncbi:MAG: MinD/ParA family protein [Planctomycetota bacterium]|nr:MAG: MinD/ParA family protein [Planctomycetota bacterium]